VKFHSRYLHQFQDEKQKTAQEGMNIKLMSMVEVVQKQLSILSQKDQIAVLESALKAAMAGQTPLISK
jgi:hypothetical protein